jgi:anti-sigma factor RsiW
MEINIDISNYEEYLLSAVDGELSGEELAALEIFLQQYPHIREELVLLESVKVTPDTDVQFDFKNELYHESIQLLDYVDGELHGAEKLAFEALVQQDAALSKELNLLQRARLQPDLNLLFEDKASLYKHNSRKILPVWWWSTAAAVVAGVAIWVLPVLPGKEHRQVAVNKVNQQVVDSQQSVAVTNEQASVSTDKSVNAVSEKPAANSSKPPAEKQQLVKTSEQSNKQGTPLNNITEDKPAIADNSNPSTLSKLAQPVPTSKEVVQQLQDKLNEQQEQVIADAKDQKVMANSTAINTSTNKVAEAVAAPAQGAQGVQGELVVSVSMNGDSKLLNGVANVARFFSRKKK